MYLIFKVNFYLWPIK